MHHMQNSSYIQHEPHAQPLTHPPVCASGLPLPTGEGGVSAAYASIAGELVQRVVFHYFESLLVAPALGGFGAARHC